MIRLRTLGECVIEVGSTSFTPDFDSLFAALVYLTTERAAPTPRAAISRLLWPHHDGDEARHCLRQLLYRMRNAGIEIRGARDTIAIPDSIIAPTFAAAPSAERLVAERDAGTLRLGGFLPDYWPKLSEPLAQWMDAARTTVESRVRRVLLEVARAHRLRGEWEQVEKLAVHCLQLDPLNQEATFAHTEATAMLGGKGDALNILDRYIGELTGTRDDILTPAILLRRRIAERFPARSYASRADQCFVGRAETLELLARALDRARAGQGNGVVLTGAPGIGKTRVTQEFLRAAALQGARVVRVSIQESDRHRPMSAFAEAVPQLRTLPGAIGVSPDSVAYLLRLTEPLSAPAVEDHVDPHWIATRIRQSVVDLVDAVTAESTLLLLVDDVHWLDAQSWSALAAITDGIARRRMLLVLTSRQPYPTADTPQRCVTHLALHPIPQLDPVTADALVRSVAASSAGRLDDAAVAWCIAAGEGNPLFLRELAAHRAGRVTSDLVPPSLAGLLDGRLDALTSLSRRLVDAVAIADGVATLDELAEILQLTAHEMASALGGLSDAGLLSEESPTAELRHELLKRRVLGRMSPTVRRLFHRRTAATLSAAPAAAQTTNRRLAAASHWQAAGDTGKALQSLLESAAVVEPLGSPGESARLLRAAVELPMPQLERRAIQRRLAIALSWDGRWRQIASILSTLTDQPSLSESMETRANDTLLSVHTLFRLGGNYSDLLTTCLQILNTAALSKPTRLLAARKALVLASNAAIPPEAIEIWNQISDVNASDAPLALEPHLIALMRATLAGNGREMMDISATILKIAVDENVSSKRVEAMFYTGEAHRALGYTIQAKAIYEATQDEAFRLGMQYMRARAAERLTLIELHSGNPSSGKMWLDLYSAITQHTDEVWERLASLSSNIKLAILEGRFDDAKKLQEVSVEIMTTSEGITPWQRRDHITATAELQLAIHDGPIEMDVLLGLQEVHDQMATCLLHDRTAEALNIALVRQGAREQATQMLTEYLRRRLSDVAWNERVERLVVGGTR